MYKILKQLIFFGLIVISNTWAMDVDRSANTSGNFNLQYLMTAKELEPRLNQLQTVANMMLFQAESYKSLKRIIPVLEVLHTLQPYRVLDQEGKKFLSAFRMTTDEVPERYTKQFGETREINVLNVHVTEAHALALQVGHLLRDWKLHKVSQSHLLDTYLEHPNENIRAVAGMTKHYVYSYQLAHLIFETPQAITSLNGFLIEEKIDDNFIVEACSLDMDAYLAIMRLPNMREIIRSLASLVEYYRASGTDDDMFEMYISPDCMQEVNRAKQLCSEFERILPLFIKLYDQVRCEMSKLILQGSKKDRGYQQELRECYCIRSSVLFNTNAPCKLVEDSADLARCYVVDPELPQALDCRVIPAPVFAKPVSSDHKKSFLPVGNSAPVIRKSQQGKKKKTKSQPTTRSQSPNQINEELSFSTKEIVKPIAIPAAVPALRTKLPTLRYDQRVSRWFDPNTQDPEVICATSESVEYHCFSRIVDQYLLKFGVQTPWQNKSKSQRAKDVVVDTNYSLGGSIECAGKVKRFVVFNCCLDRMGICYHRGFDVKEKNQLFDEYFENNCWKVFHRDEFPSLSQIPVSQIVAASDKKNDEIISEDDLCVKIRDNHLDMDIVLFKPSKN